MCRQKLRIGCLRKQIAACIPSMARVYGVKSRVVIAAACRLRVSSRHSQHPRGLRCTREREKRRWRLMGQQHVPGYIRCFGNSDVDRLVSRSMPSLEVGGGAWRSEPPTCKIVRLLSTASAMQIIVRRLCAPKIVSWISIKVYRVPLSSDYILS